MNHLASHDKYTDFFFICREASFLSDQKSQKSRNANDQVGPNQDVRNRDSQQGAAPNGVDNGFAMAKEVRSLNFCSNRQCVQLILFGFVLGPRYNF